MIGKRALTTRRPVSVTKILYSILSGKQGGGRLTLRHPGVAGYAEPPRHILPRSGIFYADTGRGHDVSRAVPMVFHEEDVATEIAAIQATLNPEGLAQNARSVGKPADILLLPPRSHQFEPLTGLQGVDQDSGWIGLALGKLSLPPFQPSPTLGGRGLDVTRPPPVSLKMGWGTHRLFTAPSKSAPPRAE
jgi:hypothetical protein